ncbi:MAG: lysylphosphatidylglycerol synthase transmembrane domain-containing protein [Bacteroidota bacterium]
MLTRKTTDLLIKILIVVGAYLLVYFQVKHSQDIHQVWEAVKQAFSNNGHFLFIIFAMMLINWGIEAGKWQFLAKRLQPFSWFKAFRSVMSGVSIGLFTPNRTGEFAGRILYLQHENRVEGTVLSLIGSYAQFSTTLIAGIPALLFFLITWSDGQMITDKFHFATILSVLTAILLIVLYFNLSWIYKLLIRIQFLKKYKEKLHHLRDVKKKDLFYLLTFSVVRYAVFIGQFYLICHMFGLDIYFHHVFVAAANVYFLMSMLPVFTLGEPGLRGSLTGIFFMPFTLQISTVISASVLLWIINVLFVALAGALFLLNQKILNHENTTGNSN